MTESTQKKCFVISPIDEAGTVIRSRADWLLRGIIKPVLESAPYNYYVKRADEFPEPGMITSQVIEAILDWDLVIADLSGKNPNVFYELALRHMCQKPVIHMLDKGERLPFDVSEYRAVSYAINDIQHIEDAKIELNKQLDAVLAPDYKLSNPVTKARGYQQMAKSSDPQEKITASLMEKIERMENRLNNFDNLNLNRKLNGETTLAPQMTRGLLSAILEQEQNRHSAKSLLQDDGILSQPKTMRASEVFNLLNGMKNSYEEEK
ncbi:MAG TPA: hypothetical protein VGO34_08010 [Alphaproteobacteria bacterium]|jgi:hypothetical protein